MLRLLSTCWPGFANGWYRGELHAALVAVLFSVCLQILWIARWHWPQWLAGSIQLALVAVMSAAIVGTLIGSVRGRPLVQLSTDEATKLLVSAQRAYLKAEYFDAEAALHRILASGNEDIPASLLLCDVLRRTGRKGAAAALLERLGRLASAGAWQLEIAAVARSLTGDAPKAPDRSSEPDPTEPDESLGLN